MRSCHDHPQKTASLPSFFFVDQLDRELIPRSLQPTPIRWVPRASLSLPSSEHRPSREERPRPPVRPLALSSVTARADGRAGGGRRRRLLARLHLARAPLPLKGRTDGRRVGLSLAWPPVLPSTLEFLCWCQGVRGVSADRRREHGRSQRGGPRATTDVAAVAEGGRSLALRGWGLLAVPGLPPPARRGAGQRLTAALVLVYGTCWMEEEEEERNPLCVPTDARTEAVTETASFEASRASERSVGQ